MANLVDYSNYVFAAYVFTGAALFILMIFIIVKYFAAQSKTKKPG